MEDSSIPRAPGRQAPKARRVPAWSVAAFAAACCLAALVGFGLALTGYSHAYHPVGLLGARGIERAAAFNVLGFGLPGVLLAAVAWRLRERLEPAGRAARIGAWLWLLSALAWAAQGALALDPQDLDAAASRWHAVAWLLWWLAFVPGASLLAGGLARVRGHGALALLAGVAGAVVLAAVVAADQRLVPAAAAQRAALLAWLAAYLGGAWRAARRPG